MKAQAQKLEEMERKLERLRMQHEHDKIEHVSAWQVRQHVFVNQQHEISASLEANLNFLPQRLAIVVENHSHVIRSKHIFCVTA